jgi:hypothetical protein
MLNSAGVGKKVNEILKAASIFFARESQPRTVAAPHYLHEHRVGADGVLGSVVDGSGSSGDRHSPCVLDAPPSTARIDVAGRRPTLAVAPHRPSVHSGGHRVRDLGIFGWRNHVAVKQL